LWFQPFSDEFLSDPKLSELFIFDPRAAPIHGKPLIINIIGRRQIIEGHADDRLGDALFCQGIGDLFPAAVPVSEALNGD